jgi:hypothetical protein
MLDWVWAIAPMALREWTAGGAASLQDSIKALAAVWAKLLNQTSPERLQRAWDCERAAEARAGSKHVL